MSCSKSASSVICLGAAEEVRIQDIISVRALQENARQADLDERERQTQALLKVEAGTQRRATAVGWGIARNKAAQTASATRMAQLTEDFAAIQAATGLAHSLTTKT